MGNHTCLATPFQMFLDGTLSGIKGIHLAGRIICCRSLVHPPVIQDPGDVSDMRRFLRTPEDQVIILGSVKSSPETAHFFHQLLFRHKEMADVIIGPEKILVKIRLHKGLEMFGQIRGHLILIGINHSRTLLLI